MRLQLQPYETCNYLNCEERFLKQMIGMPNECLGMCRDRNSKFTCDVDEKIRGRKYVETDSRM